MDTYYSLLDIPAHATAAEIELAYQRQLERYSPARVAELGAEFRTIAEARAAARLRRATRCLQAPSAGRPTTPALVRLGA